MRSKPVLLPAGVDFGKIEALTGVCDIVGALDQAVVLRVLLVLLALHA